MGKVLVVGTIPGQTDLSVSLVEESGHQAVATSTADDALRKLAEERPKVDLVVLWGTTHLNTYQLGLDICEQNLGMPIIYIADSLSARVKERGWSHLSTDRVVSELDAAVAQLLG
ncbi:MAG TPA: hypothetical protein VG102_00690 [Candidatus Paceibacterota bacterium]|jgi:DNA-binding NtrC family response regulator|nr:hypothetical protein [Candidatus Paceibacterota bacterium]